MKKRLFFLAAIGVLALNACVKEPIVENAEPAASKIVFTATTELASETKTMLSGNDAEGYHVLWQSGDSITVVDAAMHAGVYSTTSTTTTGEFSYVRGTEANTPDYKAYYPASIYNGGALTLPATQEYVAGNVAQFPMCAESSTPSLSFTNLCGILRLRITSTQGPISVRYITVSANEPMSGAFSVTDSAAVISSGTAGVTLDCGPSGTAIGSEAKDFYIAVPANEYTDLKITVMTTSFAQQTRTANKPIVVTRSKITPVSLSFNNLAIVYTNLSSPETANSYIVSKAGAYKFKANVAGNGIAPLSGISLGVGAVASADLLWATLGTDIAPSSGDLILNVHYENGYVFFETGREFREGNALIAVRDASSNILWSWHIWFESDDLEAMAQKFSYTYTIMDRNLGATTNCYSADNFFDAGLYYEWGRKDPFTGVVSRSNSATRVAKKGNATTTNVVSMDMAGSIAHPTDISSGGIDGATWNTASKNIFDPCPPGWKVPDPAVFSPVSGGFTWESGKGASQTKWVGQTYKYWFPAAGAYGHGNLDLFTGVGEASYTYTTTSDYARSFDISSSIRGSMQNKDSYWACNVRCVKDAVMDLSGYKDLSLAGTYLNTAGGTANCYIVKPSANEHFKFPVTVRGNGSADLAGISRNIPEGDIASAEIVWSSFGTSTVPGEDDLITGLIYKDGYVYFSVPPGAKQKKGNVIVAVKDGAGNILWSWHLWKGGTANSTSPLVSGAVMMEWNLGATSTMTEAVDSSTSLNYGLLYQWGRKDPFLNAPTRATYTSTEAAVRGASIESHNAFYTVAQTIQNPTHFPFTYNETPWMIEEQRNIALWDSAKTIFDPCPPGWKVPSKASWGQTFVNNWSANSTKKAYGYGVYHNSKWIDIADTGFRQGVKTMKNQTVYIQGAGIIQHRGEETGYYRYWCSDGVLWRDSFDGTNTIGLFDYDVNLNSDYFYYGSWRDSAFSVRCEKEQ